MANQLQTNLDEILNEKETKILPENIKKDVKIFDIVGTLEEGGASTDVPVKLFETQEEMQADETAEEGDLAVVYRNEIQNATVDSHFQTATFPDTVVLDNAITDYVEVRYRAVDSSEMFDCWGQLDSSRFSMDCYTETGSIRITYTSSDGITYTRIDDGEETVDFGTEIYYERTEMWNDAIGKFIQVGGSTFEGLYKYSSYADTNYIDGIINMVDENTYDTCSVDISKLKLLLPGISNILPENVPQKDSSDTINYLVQYMGDNIYNVYDLSAYYNALGYDKYTYYIPCLVNINNTIHLLSRSTETARNTYFNDDITTTDAYTTTGGYCLFKWTINTSTDNISVEQIASTAATDCTEETYTRQYITEPLDKTKPIFGVTVNDTTGVVTPASSIPYTDLTNSLYLKSINSTRYKYQIAPSQLTLSNSNELLPGKIAYGKNGVVEADGTIYNNLDGTKLYERLYPEDKEHFGLYINTVDNSDIAKIKAKQKGIASTNIMQYVINILKTNIAEHFSIDTANANVQSIYASNETYIAMFGSVDNNKKTYANIILYNYITDEYKLFYTVFDFTTSYSANLGARLIDKNFYIRLAKGSSYDYVKTYKFDLSVDNTDITNTVINDLTGREVFMTQISNNIIVTFYGNAIDCLTGKTYSNMKSTGDTTYGTIIMYDDFNGHVITAEYDRDNRRIYIRYLIKTNNSASVLTTLQASTSLKYDGNANMYLLKLADNRYMILFKYDTTIMKTIIQDGKVELEKTYTGTKIETFTFAKFIDENTITLTDNVIKFNDDNTYTVEDAEHIYGITSTAMIDTQKEYGMKAASSNLPYLEYLLYDGLDILVTPSLLSKSVQFGFTKNTLPSPISQKEYDQALDTAAQIKGE